jgi:serine/threonine protein kinase
VSTIAAGTLVLDRYELLVKAGEGGTSVVHRARDTSTGRMVAAKIARGHSAWEFAHEAEILASLPPHPGLPSLLDSGPGVIIMPWIEGRPLLDVSRDELGAPVPQLLMLSARSALDARCALHVAGVKRGDGGASNLRINSRVVLVDFGGAQFLDESRCRCGIPDGDGLSYPPEHDVWQLAQLALWLLTGRWLSLPNALAWRRSIAEQEATDPGLSSAIGAFFAERFLLGAPSGWPTMSEVRDALDAALADVGITDPDAEFAALLAAPDAYRRAFAARR